MRCEIVTTQLSDNRWKHQCRVCKRKPIVSSSPNLFPPQCTGSRNGHVPEQAVTPSVMQRVLSASRAVTRWIAAGSPTRKPEEIDRIYTQICLPCQHQQDGLCTLCGCYLGNSERVLANKIRMGTESCPASPPKWKAEVE